MINHSNSSPQLRSTYFQIMRTFCQMLLYSSLPSWTTLAAGMAASSRSLMTEKPSHRLAHVPRTASTAVGWFFWMVYLEVAVVAAVVAWWGEREER